VRKSHVSPTRTAKTRRRKVLEQETLRRCVLAVKHLNRYQISFIATCTTRPGPDPVIRPNVADDMFVTGLLKFT